MDAKIVVNYIIPYGFISLWLCFSIYYLVRSQKKIKNQLNNKKDEDSKTEYNIHLIDSIPSVFTTLGIFGTFIGIAYGLWLFDIKNIDKSISTLLTGLNTVFITSVIGLLLSLFFSRWVEYLHKLIDYVEEEKEKAILDTEKEFRSQIIQAITTSLNDSFKTITNNLEKNIKDFIENTKQNNATIITNLTDRFNNFLNDNFNRLGHSIDRLIDLQNNNQEYLDKVYQRFDQIVNSLSATSHILSEITKSVRQLTDDNSILKTIVKELEKIIVEESIFSKSVGELKIIAEVISNQSQKIERNSQLLEKSIQREDELAKQSKELLQKFDIVKNTFDNFISRLNTIPNHLQSAANDVAKITSSVQILSDSRGILKKMVGEEVENRREIIEEYGRIISRTAGQLQSWYNQEKEFGKLMQDLIKDLQRNEWIKRESSFTKAIQDLIEKIENTESYRLQVTKSWEDIKNQYKELLDKTIEFKDDFVEKMEDEKNILLENLEDINEILKSFTNNHTPENVEFEEDLDDDKD